MKRLALALCLTLPVLATGREDAVGIPTRMEQVVLPGSELEARPLEAKDTGILKHIENNVDLEIEMGKMVKNSAMHSLATNLLAHQFNLLREAISERVNS